MAPRRALLLLSAAGVGAAAAAKRRPLLVSVSGGGFTSMTGGIALMRTMHEQGVLPSVTHLGGNSGGSFFGIQFMHSKGFFDNVTNPDLPLETLVSDWLDVHVDLLKGLMVKGGPLQQEFGPPTMLKPEKGCPVVNMLQRFLFGAVKDAAQVPLRWQTLVGGAVLKHSLGDDAATATFADREHTLPNTTLVTVTVLPPDAWTSHNKETGRTDINTLHVTMRDGSSTSFADAECALPVAFVSSGPSAHGWSYNEDIAALSLVRRCPYTGRDAKKCDAPPYTTNASLPLPAHPLLAEMASASGGAAGFAGSPTVYGLISAKVISLAPSGTFCKLLECVNVLDRVASCWPYGLQALAPPMMPPGASVATAETSDPQFRYMDGGYAENTAVAMTLAKAQRDCKAGLLNCDRPVDIILVNDGNSTATRTGPGPMFAAADPLRALFHDPSSPRWVPGMFGSVSVPAQGIFAESFPAPTEWTPYNSFPSIRKEGILPGSVKKIPENITSHYWSGELTTVENKYYGVTAGQKVRLLVFSLDVPGIIWPGLFDPDQMQRISPGHYRMVDGSVGLDLDVIAGHAPMTKAQAVAVAPILKQFLADPADRQYKCSYETHSCVEEMGGVGLSTCQEACA